MCISLEWGKAFLTKLSHDQSHTAERDLWLTAFEYSNDDGKTFYELSPYLAYPGGKKVILSSMGSKNALVSV